MPDAKPTTTTLNLRLDSRSLVEAFAEATRSITEFGARIRRALIEIERAFRRPVLVIDDPADRWARSPREFVAQLRDIVRHEFWMAQDRAERSPGARWVYQATPLETAAAFEEQMGHLRSRAGASAGQVAKLAESVRLLGESGQPLGKILCTVGRHDWRVRAHGTLVDGRAFRRVGEHVGCRRGCGAVARATNSGWVVTG